MLPASSQIDSQSADAHGFVESRAFQTARAFRPAILCLYGTVREVPA